MFCNINFEGRVTKEIEVKSSDYGDYCFTTLAFNRNYKDKAGEWQEVTTFVPCLINDAFSLNKIKEAKKGSKLLVSGAFHTTKKEGEFEKLIIKIMKIYSITAPNPKNPDQKVESKQEIDDEVPF